MAANNSLILGADLKKKKKSINLTLKRWLTLKSSITDLEGAVSQQCSTFCVVLPITRPLSRYATLRLQNALSIVEVHIAIKLVHRHPTFNNVKETIQI